MPTAARAKTEAAVGSSFGQSAVWLFGSLKLKELLRFSRILSRGGPGLNKKLDKEKKPYLFVGLVCVREAYQGQGYMRKLMDMALRKDAGWMCR